MAEISDRQISKMKELLRGIRVAQQECGRNIPGDGLADLLVILVGGDYRHTYGHHFNFVEDES